MPQETYYLHRDGKTYPFRYCTAAPTKVTETIKSAEYQKIWTDDGLAMAIKGNYTAPNAAAPYPDNTYYSKVNVATQKGVTLIPDGAVTIEKTGNLDGITTRTIYDGLFASVNALKVSVSDHKNPDQPYRVDDLDVTMWSVTTEKNTGASRTLTFQYLPGDIFSNAPLLGMPDDTVDA